MRAADETEQLRLLLKQTAERTARRSAPCPGRFISSGDRADALREARQAGVAVSLDGGWSEAERLQVCFHPEGMEPEFTAVWLKIAWNRRFSSPRHRDLLGSLLALGIDRSYSGDLVMQEDEAWLYALPELAGRLPQEWTEAGHIPIRVEIAETPPELVPPRGVTLRQTVASCRLDCVLAAGLHLSRAAAAEMIRSGRVMVDHRTEDRIDTELNEGALLSVRGEGRIRLRAIGNRTRHDRLSVELETFLKNEP